jgi:hypothetical protein
MKIIRALLQSLLAMSLHVVCSAMPVSLPHTPIPPADLQAKSLSSPYKSCAKCYQVDSVLILAQADGEGSIAMTLNRGEQWFLPKKLLLPGGVEQRFTFLQIQPSAHTECAPIAIESIV